MNKKTLSSSKDSINCLKDIWFWVLIACTFLYRSLFYLANISPWLFPDSIAYSKLAQLLASQGTFGERVWLAPGYPVLLAFSKGISAENFAWVAVSVQHLLGIFSVGLVYAIGIRFYKSLHYPRFWAFISGFLYLSARFAIYDHTILADSIFTSLIVFQSYFLIRYFEDYCLKILALLGFCLGLSILIKPIDQLGWVIPLVTVLLFRLNWRQVGRGVLVLLIPICLLVSLWVGRNYFYFDYFGLSAYSGYQLLIRTSKFLDKEKSREDLSEEVSLQGISPAPNASTRGKLKGIATKAYKTPQEQEKEYRRLLKLLMTARLAQHLEELRNYGSRSVFYTFRDYYQSGFPELEVTEELGKIAQGILKDPGERNTRKFLRDSFYVHVPTMMGLKPGVNLAYYNYLGLEKKLRNPKFQESASLKVLTKLTHYFFWKDIFKFLTPIALLGLVWAALAKIQLPFTFYSFFRILYFPAVISIYGNGFERYRLPADHLIILGAVFLPAVLFKVIRKAIS